MWIKAISKRTPLARCSFFFTLVHQLFPPIASVSVLLFLSVSASAILLPSPLPKRKASDSCGILPRPYPPFPFSAYVGVFLLAFPVHVLAFSWFYVVSLFLVCCNVFRPLARKPSFPEGGGERICTLILKGVQRRRPLHAPPRPAVRGWAWMVLLFHPPSVSLFQL